MSEEHGAVHAELRVRVLALVADVDPAGFDAPAAATPGWRVRDVLAHMVGVSDDVVNGRLEGIATDPWTAAQVERRRAVPIAELLADWEHYGPGFEQLLAGAPAEIAGQAVFDAATHEHDLRQALRRPGARESDAIGVAWAWMIDSRARGGAPAIRMITEHADDVAGVGDPNARVRAPRFELFRATTGRRTHAEIAAYDWDPAPDLAALITAPIFTVRSESLGE